VRDADEIIILDHGRIAERGTHDQLMALKGSYYHTYMTQYPDEAPAIDAPTDMEQPNSNGVANASTSAGATGVQEAR